MTNTSTHKSKIIGIQFSLLSADQIRTMSVAEITSKETYINNKPVIGGVFDPRLGVLDPGLICPTDGLDNISCPGYFGHIELAKPVFYIQYLSTILKILKVVCYKCSQLLISKEMYKEILKECNNEKRWNKIYQLASKVKRCGDATDNGCGCLQPCRIKKEGLATIIAEWDNIEGLNVENSDKLSIKLIPELVLKIFRRISNDDINFMGFSSLFSRPEWMICEVLAVPPPAVRPSVKHNVEQRSEDDLTHILINIIKTNQTLLEKINNKAQGNIIEDWAMILQYYIATMVDNNISGVASIAQRSGRPLKSIKERLNGKIGRVRGNLMGKRVDFSARSVITPDPNLSIQELGVPIKIAKNITKPVKVNRLNHRFLLTLVHNGPDVYPGAKNLQRKGGENISLRYVDRDSIVISEGDIVHRHIMNGDGVLFNRQPTLHRMSMMCHIVKIMKQGDTFRMNVGVTKPYNADFDGDEMNMHMPQDIESETELKNLAAIPYQIISPANNQSIIGIFQDSLLGIFRLTNKGRNFDTRTAMNLLMKFNKVDERLFLNNPNTINNFELLTQILPPLSLKYKTRLYKDGEENSNYMIEIINGIMKRGNIDKSVLGSGGKGLIQRICNDYGNKASMEFIDNLQNIVTEFMKYSGYSVGISDLIADNTTNEEIIKVITKKKKSVKVLIDQVRLGVFENKTGQSTLDEFEMSVNAILNEATAEAGKLGRNNLDKDNRFVIMVNAGSKGSDINISQMIATLGQQNVDGKRIPYGFDSRTLPHFCKYDDSPEARGFVQSSFISGLSPTELFFHAQGGRVGLIDTAVKTSQTGYLQRRLIKGMEDIKTLYDMTVRNNKNKIVQFTYGDDCADAVKIEPQTCPLPEMSLEDIYQYFYITHDKSINNIFEKKTLAKMKRQKKLMLEKCKEITDTMIDMRNKIVKNVFNYNTGNRIHITVAFYYIINNIANQLHIQNNSQVDITPLDCINMLDKLFDKLNKLHYSKPNLLFKTMFYYYCFPSNLLIQKRFNRAGITLLLETIHLTYMKGLIAPGEMVGMIAAQSIGEPTTQLTLNTFHFAGVASKSNVTKGVPRVEEILSLTSNLKRPALTIYLLPEEQFERYNAIKIMNMIELTTLNEIVTNSILCFDPENSEINNDLPIIQNYQEFQAMMDEECASDNYNKWVIRFELDRTKMLDKNITMDDVHFAIYNSYKEEVQCVYSDYNDSELIFRLRMKVNSKIANSKLSLDQTDEIYKLTNFRDYLLENLQIQGISSISKVILRKNPNVVIYEEDRFVRKDVWVLDTVGSNLQEILGLDYIDKTKTISNSIMEVYNVLGIEAARQSIYNEFVEVLEDNDTYINERHLTLLCDRMTYSTVLISIFRHGINNDNIGPLAKASFEETPEQFLKAARHAELDSMRGISANVMCGQEGYFGTNSFDTFLDLNVMKQYEKQIQEDVDYQTMLESVDDPNDPCSQTNMGTYSLNVVEQDTGCPDDDYDIDI
tara:strand:+ start:212 stop:4660 length:4449 start_codon:yes stop_codon:yes gene_type:complete